MRSAVLEIKRIPSTPEIKDKKSFYIFLAMILLLGLIIKIMITNRKDLTEPITPTIPKDENNNITDNNNFLPKTTNYQYYNKMI